MNVRAINFDGLGITAARGAKSASDFIGRGFELIAAVSELGIEVLPGQETGVIVPFKERIPLNAKFNRLKGKIRFWESAARTGFTVTRKLGDATADTNTFTVAGTNPAELRNVKVRLADSEVFWSQPGPLKFSASQSSFDLPLPDFASAANQALEIHPPLDGKLQLTFLVQSESRVRVNIVIDSTDYEIVLLQTKTWENEMDATLRFDRNLDLDFCSTKSLELDTAQSNDYRRLQAIRLDVAGQPGEPRVLSSIETHDNREFGIVSSQFSIAQEVRPAFPLLCTGISACLLAASDAELYLEVRDDLPSGASRTNPKGKASIKLTQSDAPAAAWVLLPLEPEIALDAGQPCWIILRAIRGVIHLAMVSGRMASITPDSAEGPTTKDQEALRLLVNRGGQLWKPFCGLSDCPSALLRFIYLPDADHQTAAVELGLVLGSFSARSQRTDISTGPQSVRFDFAGDNVRLGPGDKPQLVVKSHMHGELTVANLVQEFAK